MKRHTFLHVFPSIKQKIARDDHGKRSGTPTRQQWFNREPTTEPGKELNSEAGQGPGGLPLVLGRRDLTVLLILIVLYISNVNGVQFSGPAALVYWALGIVTFIVPLAYMTQQLSLRFGRGVPYLWATQLLGPKLSFFTAFTTWWPGVLSIVPAVEVGILFARYLWSYQLNTPLLQFCAIVVILAFATGLACLPLRALKYVLLSVVIAYSSIFFLVGGLGVWWLLSGHQSVAPLQNVAAWTPNGQTFGVFGIVILGLLGIEAPLFMGDEVKGGPSQLKHVSHYLWIGSGFVFIAYGLATFGVMVILPAKQAAGVWACIDVLTVVLGRPVGNVAALMMALSQVGVAATFLLVFSRLLYIVARDRYLPVALTRINRYGVPYRSVLAQALVIVTISLLAFVALPAIVSVGTSLSFFYEVYNVLLGSTSAFWLFAIGLRFIFVLWSLKRKAVWLEGPRQSRLWLLIFSILGLSTTIVGMVITITVSWLPDLIPNARWQAFVLSVILLSIAFGWLMSELPRLYALLAEQRRLHMQESTLNTQLQDSYDEQQILVAQQQELLHEVNRLYREQEQAAITDAITGLPNHRAIMNRIEEESSRYIRTNSETEDLDEVTFAVLFLDLDLFKQVNDTWGHRAGDAVLREIGARLRSTLRLEDFVGRYGGEEFAVILTNTNLYGAYQSAERLRLVVSQPPCYWEVAESMEVVSLRITVSIGVALYRLHGITREALIEAADHAMYLAKQSGRNRVCIADLDQELFPELPLRSLPHVVSQQLPDLLTPTHAEREHTAVQALTAAAEARDQGTNAHAKRLVGLAEVVAHALHLTDQELHLIHMAALLHDIGKIGVPDAILHKPGPLTNAEWDVMRLHPALGHDIILQAGEDFGQLALVVGAHHERWDGQGYPNGLQGEGIPISARVLTVVDSYDAMTSRRAYRQPLTEAEAQAELRCHAGSQFDPTVVAAFIEALESRPGYQDPIQDERVRT